MKVQFCCGTNKLDGWKNHDIEVDITKPLPYADNSLEQVLIEHGLEHVSCAEGFRFLREAYRILRPGGVLRVCVPELDRLSLKKAADIITNHGHKRIFCVAKNIFCEKTLRQFLVTAGFAPDRMVVTERKPCDGHWKVIGEELDRLETLRMEATK